MSKRTYLGTRFDVWNGNQAWFWLVLNSRRNAGVVGAAAREADAVQEACRSIEQMCRASIESNGIFGQNLPVSEEIIGC
jgi:hypothetical protein